MILKRQQVQQEIVRVPGKDAGKRPGNGIQDEVVRSRNDGGEDDGGVDHADAHDGETSPAKAAAFPQGHRGDGEADEERITEMERWHGS